MADTSTRGRPEGKTYPHTKSLKLRAIDVQRLEKLSVKMDRDQSWVIRRAIEELAQREGVD
jgi:predicted transcriptional regulator